MLWNLLLPSPPQPLPYSTPAYRCLSPLGLVTTIGQVTVFTGWWEGTRPEGKDGFIYLFLSHTSSRFCGGVKALAEALSPRGVCVRNCTPQVAAFPFPVAMTLCVMAILLQVPDVCTYDFMHYRKLLLP